MISAVNIQCCSKSHASERNKIIVPVETTASEQLYMRFHRHINSGKNKSLVNTLIFCTYSVICSSKSHITVVAMKC